MGALSNPSMGSPAHFPYGVVENPTQATGNADILPINSSEVFITTAGVDAMTLALPKAGVYTPSVPGSLGDPRDDGKEIMIVSTTAFAHTITTPANGINKTLHLATFAGAVGNWIQLKAFGGTWYNVGASGVVVS